MPNIPIPTIYKRPDAEDERVTFSFKKSLGTSETVTAVDSVTAKPAQGLSITGIVLSSPQVQCLVSGGIDAEKYVLTAQVQTSGGQTLHNDVILVIEEAKTE